MSLIQPWLRDYNYISSYFSDIYNYYSKVHRAYPINYYSIDKNNTVWDDVELNAGSYEKAGVGELSGVKWKKIFKLPVDNIEQILPSSDNSESGQTQKESLYSSFSIPGTYGIKPSEWDVVDLNFAFNSNIINQNPLYVVTDLDFAHSGIYNKLYKCYIKVAPFSLSKLEEQISSYHVYVDSIDKIVPVTNADLIYKLENSYSTLKQMVDSLYYNSSIGLYLK